MPFSTLEKLFFIEWKYETRGENTEKEIRERRLSTFRTVTGDRTACFNMGSLGILYVYLKILIPQYFVK